MHRKAAAADRAVAIITALGVLVSAMPLGAFSDSGQAAQAKPPATTAKPATTPTTPAPGAPVAAKTSGTPADTPPLDGGWPRMYPLPSGGSMLVYQPQVSTWKDQKQMVAFSAVSYRDKAATTPAFGTLRMEADTSVALSERLVSFKNLRTVEATFQT